MRSLFTPLPENLKSKSLKNEQGFSLLEVVVALTILAGGFLTVLNLFSGGVLSVSFSDQYLKAVTLANSKINELEMLNFKPIAYEGNFNDEEGYRWEVNIEPYDSPLNEPGSSIQLQKVFLQVLWEDNNETRNVELTTLHMKGQTYPASNSSLEKLFAGGASPGSSSEGEGESEVSETPSGSSASSGTSSSSSTSNLSGATTSTFSVISRPTRQAFIFGAGCVTPRKENIL